MSEYKEFWIQASNMIAHDDKPPIAKQLFHVIEYAAFEKLQKDWEQAATQNYADKCEIEKLKKQNEILNNCLDKVDWHIRGMQNERIITMKQMAAALKVISDNLQALKDVEGVG